MRWIAAVSQLLRGLAFVALLGAASAQAQDAKPYTKEQLDQMTAQVALYPDSLLSQLFMATTYPDEFAEAVKWSKAHQDAKGDEAVKQVEGQNWDPSVASMVAFPEVLITLGEKTDWVKNMGDAFLAQPEDVMDSVQRLRAQAQKAGNLKSSEQVKVSTQAAPPPEQAAAPASAPAPQVIVIEQTQPQIVYVPAYNPTTVYGPWLWPSYPPYYYPYPPGYWWSRPIATGIAWGVGIGVSNALWGGFNWGRGDVDININRYNNINVNNKLDIKGGNKTWNHNPEHRKASYRGGETTRQNLDKKYQSGNREQYRGHDANRDASRERANQAMANRGVEAPKGSATDRAKAMERDGARDRPGGGSGQLDGARDRAGGGGGQLDGARDRAGGGGGGSFDGNRDKLQSADRSAARQNAQASSRDNALRGANSPQARQQADRGAMSHASANRSSGGGASRASAGGGGGSRPSAGGGGGQRPSGGGGGGRKR
jgi:hypothetical protein